jgi:hypothetical protein
MVHTRSAIAAIKSVDEVGLSLGKVNAATKAENMKPASAPGCSVEERANSSNGSYS